MRRALVLGLVVACRTAPARAPQVVDEAPPSLCVGVDDDGCQERALTQSLCFQQPDDPACEPLRALRLLPPPPPPLAELLGCWRIAQPRDDVPASWICLGADDVAIDGGGGWDVWQHGGWHRQDSARRAGWIADLSEGRTLWLTVVGAELHLTDGNLLAAALERGDAMAVGPETARRHELPSIASVCAAARACLAAMPRPTLPAGAPELEVEVDPGEDPLAGAHTLRACYGAWEVASTRLLDAVGARGVPVACALTPTRGADWDWSTMLRPPFSPP